MKNIMIFVATVCLAAISSGVYSTVPHATPFNSVDNLKITKMVEKEEWRAVPNYEGYYDVSNIGNVKSLDRWVHNPANGGYWVSGRIMKQAKSTVGKRNRYRFVSLCKNGKYYQVGVHRLVAMAFIPNPENKPQVNHIDMDEANNNLHNLEWVTMSENLLHAISIQGWRGKCAKGADAYNSVAVVRIDGSSKIIEEYQCIADASRSTGINRSCIGDTCRGRQHTAGGSVWKYKKDIA